VSLIGIRNVVLAINKLDMVDYSQHVFRRIVNEYRLFAREIGSRRSPQSRCRRLKGDNITERSANTPWYDGPPLMEYLESVEIDAETAQGQPFRMPVQWVNRPNLDFRGFSGRIAGGWCGPGDRLRVLPSGRESTVKHIVTHGGDLALAVAGQSITLVLADEIDVSRGDVLAAFDALPEGGRPVRRQPRVDERRADAARPALPAEGWDAHGRGVVRGAQVQDQRQHAGAPRGADAGAERDRRLQPEPGPQHRLRCLRREPRNGWLHRHRPAEQRDRRRRHAALRVAPFAQHPLAGDPGGQEGARGAQAAKSARSSGSRVCPARASRRLPTSSKRSCTCSAATATCSTATTCAMD
jgi:hypothetical protein